MGLTLGTPAAIGQPIDPAILVALVDLVARLARGSKLAAQARHLPPVQESGKEPKSPSTL